jgi:hypothetical protein
MQAPSPNTPKTNLQPIPVNKPRQKLKGAKWLFVDSGLDDFRNGAPSPDKIILSDSKHEQTYVEISKPPILNNEDSETKNSVKRAEYLGLTKNPKNCSIKLSKKQAVFSKKLPKAEQREELIETAENHLKAHPLALYPHLLKAVPVDLVENVSHLLESDLHFDADEMARGGLGDKKIDNYSESSKKQAKHGNNEGISFQVNGDSHEHLHPESFQVGHHHHHHSDHHSEPESPSQAAKNYRWLIRDDDKNKPTKTMREMQEEASIKRLEGVTAEFARWANELSDSTPNVDPNTIKNLFASGYETKPALTVPIQVYELSSLPAELRITEADASVLAENEDGTASILAMTDADKSGAVDSDDEQPHNKYGAWYIAPKSWNNHYKAPIQPPNKVLLERASESLGDSLAQQQAKVDTSDPNLAAIEKVRLKREMLEQAKKKKNQHIDEHEQELGLASLHASRAFRDFLDDKPELKRPEFMNKIYQLQDEMDKTK